MRILQGVEDVPAIVQDKCYFCGGELPESPWFSFVKEHGQEYLVPECGDCSKKNSPEGVKAEG